MTEIAKAVCLIQSCEGWMHHGEAASLIADAIEKATNLKFTISVSGGGGYEIVKWIGKPFISDSMGLHNQKSLFETESLLELLRWLDGVAFGRTNADISYV